MTAQPRPQAAEALVFHRLDRGVLTLTLNRPAQRNALSKAMMTDLERAIADAKDDSEVRVVIVAGAGPAFCSGHDLKEIRANATEAFYRETFEQCSRMMLAIANLPKPVIARVHGIATAAGCQLVATCDLAVAAASARFATPGVGIGLFCSTPMVALSRAVGRKPAMEMLLTGDLIDAPTAKSCGLINRIAADAELESEAMALARQIAKKSPLVLAIGKEAFYRQIEMGLEQAYGHAVEVMTRNMLAQDAEEGIDAFLGKRQPVWCGR
jgi:enoyl-CoA hydratase/carnithine racemase